MKRSLVVTVSVFFLAISVIAARTEGSNDTILIRVLSGTDSDTVTFDVALVEPDTQLVRVATTPWQMKVPAEAPFTVVFRRIDGDAAMTVDVIRCGPYCVEQTLLTRNKNEVTVVTLRERGVVVGGLPSR